MPMNDEQISGMVEKLGLVDHHVHVHNVVIKLLASDLPPKEIGRRIAEKQGFGKTTQAALSCIILALDHGHRGSYQFVTWAEADHFRSMVMKMCMKLNILVTVQSARRLDFGKKQAGFKEGEGGGLTVGTYDQDNRGIRTS